MTSGVVSGGWSYVWAAYGITISALVIYGVTLITRLRDEWSREAKGPNPQ
jgi:heme exporter protein D